jgi:hypothetical protein
MNDALSDRYSVAEKFGREVQKKGPGQRYLAEDRKPRRSIRK